MAAAESSLVGKEQRPRNTQVLGGLLLLVVGCAVAMPWLRRGYLLGYDWISGPHDSVPPAVFGHRTGIAGFTPLLLVRRSLRSLLLGVDPVALVVLFGPLIVGLAFARLKPNATVAWIAAGSLLTINPFIYDRLAAGSFGVVLGTFLTPWIAWNALQVARSNRRAIGWLAILYALQVAAAPQFLLLSAIVIGTMFAVGFSSHRVPVRKRVATMLCAILIPPILMSYWLVPTASAGLPAYSAISQQDLTVFETRSDSSRGLVLNVLGMFGNWRRGQPTAKRAGWILLFSLIFLVILVGIWSALRNPEYRPQGIGMVVIGTLGFFLALGHQGPLGGAFLWLYNHMPGFRMMREPQKSLALTLVAYAFFYGHGTLRLLQLDPARWMRTPLAIVLLAVPLTYGAAQFWGLRGYLRPSSYPTSWHQADALIGPGNEKVLVLPWHHFAAFPWTQRPVDHPARVFFTRDTITGDNIELGPIATESRNPRSAYLEFLFANSERFHSFGNLVSPIAVKYVLLIKHLDWDIYNWLYRQTDLRLVREWPDLVLFENTRPVSLVYGSSRNASMGDWEEVLAAGAREPLYPLTISLDEVEGASKGSGKRSGTRGTDAQTTFSSLAVESANRVEVRLTRQPTTKHLLLAEPFDDAWSYGGRESSANFGVTNALRIAPDGRRITFTRWQYVRLSHALSLAVFTLCVLLIALPRKRLT